MIGTSEGKETRPSPPLVVPVPVGVGVTGGVVPEEGREGTLGDGSVEGQNGSRKVGGLNHRRESRTGLKDTETSLTSWWIKSGLPERPETNGSVFRHPEESCTSQGYT